MTRCVNESNILQAVHQILYDQPNVRKKLLQNYHRPFLFIYFIRCGKILIVHE